MPKSIQETYRQRMGGGEDTPLPIGYGWQGRQNQAFEAIYLLPLERVSKIEAAFSLQMLGCEGAV